MNTVCDSLHRLCRSSAIHRFPFVESQVPINGIYILFEEGEQGHQGSRIVRVGTHTGGANLRKRLVEHFLTENKDRSIFRKHVGRALLSRDQDPFLDTWEIDLTSKEHREKYSGTVGLKKQLEVEAAVTRVIQDTFHFVAFPIDDQVKRQELEATLIGTVARCKCCRPSSTWLGLHHPDKRINNSGMWNIVGLKHPGFDSDSLQCFQEIVLGTAAAKRA